MDWDSQQGQVALLYDGVPTWPSVTEATTDGRYDMVRLDLPERLLYRRLWAGCVAVPTTNGEPNFDLDVILEDGNGSERSWFSWRIQYQGTTPISSYSLNRGFAGIRPPYCATVEGSMDPDKTSSAHAGAVDSRVLQWIGPNNGCVRLTMFPVAITGRFRRARFRISNFSLNSGLADQTGPIYAAMAVQSQMLPF